MVANVSAALNAYASAASRAVQPGATEESGGTSFGSLLEQAATESAALRASFGD